MNMLVLSLIWLLDVYLWLIIGSVIVSWLVVFGVLNTRNAMIAKAIMLLNRVTAPAMDYLRRFIPPIGGLDLSPLALIFGIYLVQGILYRSLV